MGASPAEVYEKLIRSAARRLKGHHRRLFQAEVPRILPWAPKTVHVTASGPVEQFVSHP